MQHPQTDLIALTIQQPWAELILQGIKSIEVRRVPTQLRGTIYLYTSRKISRLECARSMLASEGISPQTLPLGRVVGTVEIVDCRRAQPNDARAACVSASLLADSYSWILRNAQRLPEPLDARYVPFGTWFYPFQRLRTETRRRRKHDGA